MADNPITDCDIIMFFDPDLRAGSLIAIADVLSALRVDLHLQFANAIAEKVPEGDRDDVLAAIDLIAQGIRRLQ